jgi:HlyD family secretion protein
MGIPRRKRLILAGVLLTLAAITIVLTATPLGAALLRLTGLSQFSQSSQSIRVSGNIEVTDAEVSFKIPGIVEKRLVDEGEWVEAGQVVTLLDTSDLLCDVELRRADVALAKAAKDEVDHGPRPEEIAAARAVRDKAEHAWRDLKAGSREQEIAAAKAAVSAAESDEARLRIERARAAKLLEKSSIPVEDFDRAKSFHEVASQRLRQAVEQLSLAEEGTRPEQILQAEAAYREAAQQCKLVEEGARAEVRRQAAARLQQAEAALKLAETRLGYATLRSPLSGMVLSKNIESGEYVSPGTPVITVGKIGQPWLRAYINERDLDRVKLGQRARVTTDSGKAHEGVVAFIADKAEFTPKNVQTEKERVKLVFRIKINVDNPGLELKPGMPADAEIVVE